MEDYIVLTFSQRCDAVTACNAARSLASAFPDKAIIVLPESIHCQAYSKEELLDLLYFYTDYIKELLHE